MLSTCLSRSFTSKYLRHNNTFRFYFSIFSMVIVPLKSLQKLEYISFKGNPIEQTIPMFKCYIANELPKVKYLDWIQLTKEDHERGVSLDLNDVWKSKNDPFIRSNIQYSQYIFLIFTINLFNISYSTQYSHYIISIFNSIITIYLFNIHSIFNSNSYSQYIFLIFIQYSHIIFIFNSQKTY